MKKKFLIIPVLFAAAIMFAFIGGENETQTLLSVGDKAPKTSYEMTEISGRTVSLESMKRDNGLLVMFSCNTCPFVLGWEDRYPELAEACVANGIGMVVVNSNEAKRKGDDSMEQMKSHAKDKGYNFAYAVDTDSELAKAFGATKTPQAFLFNAEMTLMYEGAIDDNMKDKANAEPYLMEAISAVAKGMKPDPEKTKAVGCSIKKMQ